jgi:phage terminase large subunit-like protein
LLRIVTAVEPTASSQGDPGIMVCALGVNGHGYALEDMTISGSPHVWGTAVLAACTKYGANLIVGEVNNGGDMVGSVIQTVAQQQGVNIAYKAVHASVGKYARAEPIAALSEQHRIHHVGYLGNLEDQLCSWVPGEGMKSPDRLDSFVWGMTELFNTPQADVEIIVNLAERVEISRI